MNFLKRKASTSTNPARKKKSNVINSDSDSSHEQSDATQPTNPNPEADDNANDDVVDTTEAENAKREEAIKKIS